MAEENITSDLTPLGLYNFRNQRKKFGIKMNDRRRHIYIVGKTGVGKTTLLKNMMVADILAGRGVGVLDPHGEFAESLLDYIPEERINDVIYFDPSDLAHPIAFNPMEQVTTEFRHLVASGIMSVFKKIWVDAWSARMEYILNNTLLALLELPDTTLMDVMRMFADKEYRKKIVESIQDPVIKAFWRDEFANYGQRLESEALASIQNKVGQLVSNPLIRNIMGQSRSTLNMRDIMDSGKILIVNLSKGKIGEDNSALLGAMIITRLQLAAMSRVDIKNEDDRRDFFLYVDEFQNFATDSFASILSEARKYHLSLVLAHQYIGQLMSSDSTTVRDAIFGNVGTIITFRVGAADAEFLEKEFMPQFTQTDLVNLAFANIYIRLMIDGLASQPFSAETLAPAQPLLASNKDVIVQNSRERYSVPRAAVEEKISGAWQGSSAANLADKIVRRDEKRLGDVLRPGGSSYLPPRKPSGQVPFTARSSSPSASGAPARPMPPASSPLASGPSAPVAEKRDPLLEEFLKSRGAPAASPVAPAGQSPEASTVSEKPAEKPEKKIFIRPNVDINELRRSIAQSLAKPAEDKSPVLHEKPLQAVEQPTLQKGYSSPEGGLSVVQSVRAQVSDKADRPAGQGIVPSQKAKSETDAAELSQGQEVSRVNSSEPSSAGASVSGQTSGAFSNDVKDPRAKPKDFHRPTVDIDELRRGVRQTLHGQTHRSSEKVEEYASGLVREQSDASMAVVADAVPLKPSGPHRHTANGMRTVHPDADVVHEDAHDALKPNA